MYWSAASSTRLNHVPDLSSLPASIVVFDFGRQVRRIACSAPYKSPREAKELMLFIPQRAKAYRDIGVQTWHYDSARSRKGDSMALERVRASGFPGLQGLTKRAVRIFPSGSKHPLEKASVCMGGKPSKLWCFVFVLLNRNMNQEPPLHITCVTQHHSKLSIRVLLTPSIQAMGPCCTPGGCKNQQLDGRSHVYNWSGDTIRTLRPRSLTGVEDQPGGGLVCGFDDKYRGEEGGGPSRRPHACRRYAGKPPASAPRGRGVPEEVRNAPPTYDRSTSSAPNYPAKRTRFKRRSRRNAKEGFDEGQALDVKALDSPAAGSAGTEPPGSNVQNLKGALGGTVRQNFPAPDTTTRKAAADNSSGVCATPTRKSSRIRNAQAHQAEADLAVNTVSIDEASARAIICAAVNDAVIGLVKSPPFVKTLAGLVREQVLEAAVAAVEGILKSTLQPQLEKATKDILTAAASMKAAVDVMEHATAALKAATSAETGADTPVEAKSGGRKGKAKKGVASASLGTSGEEALLPGTEHDQLLEVMKGALSDSLTAQLDPRFQQLLTCVQTALQQSVQAVGETAAVENAIVAKNLELISHQVRGLQESIDNNFRGLQASCDKNAKELRRLANACNTRKDERSRSATRSASLTTSAQRKGKRAAPSPSSSTSSDASSSSSDSSGEAPPPPPAAKKKHKFTRRASGATSANLPSSIGTNTVYASKQQQQPQLPQSQHPPALQQQQQQQLPQSQQPPALQQQQYQYRYQMAPQIGVTQPSMGPWNNIGIPAVAPQVQTAANCPMSYLPWAYSFQK